MSLYFGKYRGKVVKNIDPNNLGRIQVSVPSVLGDGTSSWAMPCVPYAGAGVGWYAIPPEEANIWVEFEGGDPDYPVWVGCFWGAGELPIPESDPNVKLFKTKNISLKLDDTEDEKGGVLLEVNTPAVSDPLKMIFDSEGITIDDDPSIIKLTQSNIELNHSPVKIELTPEIIELNNNDKAIAKITGEIIELSCDPVSITVADDSIELVTDTPTAKLSADGIELAHDSVTAKITSDGVELKNGSSSVNVGSSNVSINDGALEVS